MDKIRETAIEWYKRLAFPEKYDGQFEALLSETYPIAKPEFSENAGTNLLIALYQCEAIEQKYRELGIKQQILYDTLSDIKLWVDVWHRQSGELGLMETGWIKNHLSGRLFKLGRLQFCFGEAMTDIPAYNLKQNDPIIEIHIPAGEPMGIEACKASIATARGFFKRHFPEYTYRYFTCHSWLLDKGLEAFLNRDSNILAFQGMFDVVSTEESDALLKYIFGWGTVRDTISKCQAESRLAQKVKEQAINGGKFYVSYGILKL